MAKKMYFGTQERMAWVNCPAINSGISKNRWSSEGVFINGGAYSRSSSTGHKKYDFSWNLSSQDEIYEIVDYNDGLYGDGLVYFLDPFAVQKNLLPQFWAAPRLQAVDAPPLTKNARPTLVNTAVNANGYPTQSAVYTFNEELPFASLWIPVPTGYVLHFGVHGTTSGTAAITLTPDGGVETTATPLSVATTTLTNVALSSVVGGVTISGAGTGQATIAGMIAQVRPVGASAPVGRFISGRGHSGCRFSNSGPTVTGYSAPAGLDLVSATATLIETGAWENN